MSDTVYDTDPDPKASIHTIRKPVKPAESVPESGGAASSSQPPQDWIGSSTSSFGAKPKAACRQALPSGHTVLGLHSMFPN